MIYFFDSNTIQEIDISIFLNSAITLENYLCNNLLINIELNNTTKIKYVYLLYIPLWKIKK